LEREADRCAVQAARKQKRHGIVTALRLALHSSETISLIIGYPPVRTSLSSLLMTQRDSFLRLLRLRGGEEVQRP
jgi:hypothetical protein